MDLLAVNRQRAARALDHGAHHDPLPGDGDGLGAAQPQVVDRVLEVDLVERRVDGDGHAGPGHRVESLDDPEPPGLRRQLGVGDDGAAAAKDVALRREVELLLEQLVVGAMEVVDEEGEGGVVLPLEAAGDLGLAAHLDHGQRGHQEDDETHDHGCPAAAVRHGRS